MTDIVSIRGLRVPAVIGAYDWEREIEQELVVSVDIAVDVSQAARTDRLADAPVDYATAAAGIAGVLRDGKFQLIETAASRIAAHLLTAFGPGWVRVEVAKPRPDEGFTAAVTVERSRG